MSKRKKKPKKHRVLEGHKRVGKRFIPPMKQIPMSTSTSYVDDMLPELIWIGLINERVGYAPGARILEKVFLAVSELKEEGQHGNFALISNYTCLSIEQKEKLIDSLKGQEVLEEIQNAVAPLILLYDDCPLKFIGPTDNIISNEELVSRIKECVGKVINKYETPGIVLNGSMLLSRLVTGTIKFPADMDLPDFNTVITDPESEEAKHAAGFMRANALGEFGMQEIDPTWAKYFWNRNYELSPCEYESYEH